MTDKALPVSEDDVIEPLYAHPPKASGETLNQKQAREVMMPQSGGATARSPFGQSYNTAIHPSEGAIEALELVARRIVEWVRAVDSDDDLDYLNGPDGWADIRETAQMARDALAKGEPRP